MGLLPGPHLSASHEIIKMKGNYTVKTGNYTDWTINVYSRSGMPRVC